jgi:predicted transcriptional regulator
MTKPTSVRLPDELAARLDKLAASIDRPKSWVIEQAIARYVAEESWQVQAIAEAFAEYQQGKATLHPHDDVMGRLEQRIRDKTRNADTLA